MAAVCATEEYQERIAANAKNKATLMAMDPKDYIAKMKRWCELFEAGAHYPVMGVTPEQMASIKVPTIVIPGNDLTHASANGASRTSRSRAASCTGCRSRTRTCR